jgi:synaptobrevin family protein YKT6
MGDFTARFPKTAYANFKQGSPQLDMPELKNFIQKYQNPDEADSILKIQKELDETKIVMKQTIESVLERGEKIDDLVAKSDGLSAQSKMFYTQVRNSTLEVCAHY